MLHRKSGKVAAVRINPVEDPDGIKDLRAAISSDVDTVLLPKANYSYQIDKLINCINGLEKQLEKAIYHIEVFERARKLGQGQVDFDGVRIEMPTYLNTFEIVKRFNELKSLIID